MDETFGFSEKVRKPSDEWQISSTSSILSSNASDTSMCFQKTFHLHLIPKKEIISDRKMIPSTKSERLSYFRAYVSSMNKTQILCMHHGQFNVFLWFYVMTSIFKSLPHTYTYMFLASYSCEEHLFLSKMVPICVGFNIASIIAAILEILASIDTTLLILDYIYYGLLYKNPWNRCYSIPDAISYYQKLSNVTWQCYDVNQFVRKIDEIMSKNETISFVEFYYQSSNETFQLSQIEYYRLRGLYFSRLQIGTFAYFSFIWIAVALLHQKVYRTRFWKFLDKAQWIVNSIDLISFIYLAFSYFNTDLSSGYKVEHNHTFADIMWKADVEILAESTTSPPAVHVLAARGLGEIEPIRDSAIMISSNALLYMFRGILHFIVRFHCENNIRVPIHLTFFNQHTWFYVWPLFLSTFYLGNIYTLVVLFANFIMEFLTIVVTYHCIVEVIVCKYKLFNTSVTVGLTLVGMGIFAITTFNDRKLLFIYSTGIITLIETVVLYCMYPIGRLIDDITFHYGIPPTRLRVISLHFIPIYYSIKIYIMMEALMQYMLQSKMVASVPHYTWSWSLTVIPIVLGVFYSSYKYVVKNKREWKYMFCPSTTWGPRDYASRNLRKQYDSRTYIGSQALTNLSRHLLSKTECNAYRLDVRYDVANRRSTMPALDSLRDETGKSK